MAKEKGKKGGERKGREGHTLTTHLMVGPVLYSGSWLMLATILPQLEGDVA